MLDLAYQRWGRLDLLFNNAGIAEVRQLLELTEDEWDRTLALADRGTAEMSMAS